MPLLGTRGAASARGFGFGAASTLNIGAAYGGGYFAGQISTTGNGVANFNLVIAPVSSGQNSSKQWKTSNTATPGTQSTINGPANSAAMNDADHPAASFCEALSIGGFSDWYMPARDELEVCYYNLKPTTTSNWTATNVGSNAYSVPARSGYYTSGTPAQTLATDFKTGGSQAFAANDYWSSTEWEGNPAGAYYQSFNDGRQNGNAGKANALYVRAVRRVAV